MNYIILKHWVSEVSEMLGDFIFKKIQKVSDEYYIIEVYSKKLGKQFFHIILGKCIYLDKEKPKIERSPDGFVMKIRKDFSNLPLKLLQYDNERVVLLKSPEKIIVIELFSKGNIIITNKDSIIEYALIQKDFGKRRIFRGENYVTGHIFEFPTYEKFSELLKNSNKKDVVRFLSIDLRLGGDMSEKVLNALNINKSERPQNVIGKSKELYKFLFSLYTNKNTVLNLYNKSNVNSIIKEGCRVENEKLKTLIDRKKHIENIIEQQKKLLIEYEQKANIYLKIGEFLKNYSWIFSEWDKEKIEAVLGSLEINFEIKEFDKNRLVLRIQKDDLDKLV